MSQLIGYGIPSKRDAGPREADTMTDTKDTRYNGWTNWATWAFVLWATNDEGNYQAWKDAPEDARRGRWALADYLQEYGPELFVNGDMEPGDYADVDWGEVAAACEEEHE